MERTPLGSFTLVFVPGTRDQGSREWEGTALGALIPWPFYFVGLGGGTPVRFGNRIYVTGIISG